MGYDMDSDEEIQVEEKKTKLYRLPNGVEFYVLDDLVEAETGGKFSVASIGAEGLRSTKRTTHALIVNDPTYGTMPYEVWKEKTRETVMGTLKTVGNRSNQMNPANPALKVTVSSTMIGDGNPCRNCGNIIPYDTPNCPSCGTLSPVAG